MADLVRKSYFHSSRRDQRFMAILETYHTFECTSTTWGWRRVMAMAYLFDLAGPHLGIESEYIMC